MTKKYGSDRDTPPRLRLINDEAETAKYKRQGWDPRKTYAENMGFEGVFERPGEEFDPSGRYENDGAPSRQESRQERMARDLAAQGRGNDTEIAHLTPGEYVLPPFMQTPEVMTALRQVAAEKNIPFETLIIGSRRNRINPNTGAPEFDVTGEEDDQDPGQRPPYRYEGPEVDGITVTTPAEQGLVQLPQNLPNSGFYNYYPPRDKGPRYANGEAQYGTAATMGLIGEAGTRWNASGAPPFGVGDISLSDGSKYGHAGHRDGMNFDVRPMRNDGQKTGVSWGNPAYDRDATQKLVDTLRATGGVKTIFFNDPEIKGVTYLKDHDNHLHVQVDPLWKGR